MINLSPASTALILIDLQEGILPRAGGPRGGEDVVATAKALAARFRQAGAAVILVHVAFAKGALPSQLVDEPGLPKDGSPPEFSTLVPGLRADGDLVVIKHHWGAFTGTDLDLQLRRRGVRTVVIGGIATNLGVESTARSAWELSYDIVIAEDATASIDAGMHDFSITKILPRIARVAQSDEIMFDQG